LRQRPGERRVGQLVVLVGFEQLELAWRHLDGGGKRGDVQALGLARLAQRSQLHEQRTEAILATDQDPD